MTAKRQAFLKTDMETRVRRALPTARRWALLGIRDESYGGFGISGDLMESIGELIGHPMGPAVEGAAFNELEESVEAALALGIAFGLLVRPEVFKIGGAR